MFNFRNRLTSQGITWEQLAFQFIIVLLGVYLAISFERGAEERGQEEDAREMLGRVVDELRLDEAEIDAVVNRADTVAVAFDSLFLLMADGTNSHGPEIQSLLDGPLFSYPTVYPRRAAYTALVSGGYLTAIRDQGLTVELADLYEHYYSRVADNNELTDRTMLETYLVFTDNWDLDRRIFLDPSMDGTTRARNAMRSIKENYCDWYADYLLPETLAEVTDLVAELEAYLGR